MAVKEKPDNKGDGSQLLGWFFYLAVQFFHWVENILNHILNAITFGHITHCSTWISIPVSIILFIVLATLVGMLIFFTVKTVIKIILFIINATVIIFYGIIDLLIITAAYILAPIINKDRCEIYEDLSYQFKLS